MHDGDQIINGVRYLSPRTDTFSSSYVDLRRKEGRILSDKEVKVLPNTVDANPNKEEWRLRKRSALRFIKYLNSKDSSLSILDVGCGNGWFSNRMAQVSKGFSVVGLDINEMELEQAVCVFNSHNIEFVYGDLFEIGSMFDSRFDIITLNASVQYFNDLGKLFNRLKHFLKNNGEIHIIDSPFYKNSEIKAAKNRTLDYYSKMGFPEMSDHYYHHSINETGGFDILYRPGSSLFGKLGLTKDSPFMWLRYKHQFQ
jgi:ubiquinone/menaquinone biosynthesis C-methylase UbiE